MALAQRKSEPGSAKTAEEMVGGCFDTFAQRVSREYRDEVGDLIGNRQLRQQLTDGWNQYCQERNISRSYTLDDLDDFMSLRGSGIIERFMSSEENRDDFALLLSFRGEMAYNLTSGKITITEYGSEARLENYLSELEENARDAVSSGLGTYIDQRTGQPMQASIGTFELPTDVEQVTINKIAELFNGSIGYTSEGQTTVSALPRNRLPVFMDAENNRMSWAPQVEITQNV
ncbi:MAG: hypothetical protein PHY95_00850 [Candidatus ainarchaeum sp.]|nr:hypothetical protein [Candidatus ainarchaeum sp.]